MPRWSLLLVLVGFAVGGVTVLWADAPTAEIVEMVPAETEAEESEAMVVGHTTDAAPVPESSVGIDAGPAPAVSVPPVPPPR